MDSIYTSHQFFSSICRDVFVGRTSAKLWRWSLAQGNYTVLWVGFEPTTSWSWIWHATDLAMLSFSHPDVNTNMRRCASKPICPPPIRPVLGVEWGGDKMSYMMELTICCSFHIYLMNFYNAIMNKIIYLIFTTVSLNVRLYIWMHGLLTANNSDSLTEHLYYREPDQWTQWELLVKTFICTS